MFESFINRSEIYYCTVICIGTEFSIYNFGVTIVDLSINRWWKDNDTLWVSYLKFWEFLMSFFLLPFLQSDGKEGSYFPSYENLFFITSYIFYNPLLSVFTPDLKLIQSCYFTLKLHKICRIMFLVSNVHPPFFNYKL